MTVDQALAELRASVGGESAAADARLLLAHVTGRDRAWLLAHGDETLEPAALERARHLASRRAVGVPIAYLTNEAWFYGRRFEITRDVLVPRPETETLVARALDFLRARAPRSRDVPVQVCDVGTGSGIIAVTLACELPALTVDAIDFSAAALDVARRNATLHDVDGIVRYAFGDAFEGMSPGAVFDCVVANLPYVPAGEIPAAPNPLAHEPRPALDGGADGLAVYRRLLKRLPHHLLPDGALFAEAAPPTIAGLAALVRQALPDASVEIVRDAGGQDRLVAAVRGRAEREAATA